MDGAELVYASIYLIEYIPLVEFQCCYYHSSLQEEEEEEEHIYTKVIWGMFFREGWMEPPSQSDQITFFLFH